MRPAASTGAPTGIIERGRWTDGTRLRQFSVGGATVQVTAPDDAAAAELIERLHLACSIPPALPGRTYHARSGRAGAPAAGPSKRRVSLRFVDAQRRTR